MDMVLVPAVENAATMAAGVHKRVGKVDGLYVVLGVMLLLKLLEADFAGKAQQAALGVLFQKGLVLR